MSPYLPKDVAVGVGAFCGSPSWAIAAEYESNMKDNSIKQIFCLIPFSLQINPPSEQPVAHDELNLVGAGEVRGEHDLRLSRSNDRRIDHLLVLIFNI